MNEPKISIIVPVYNTEKYLRTCLDSIMAQTFTDFEVILVDDGSTDSSGKICDEYAAKDERFFVVHKSNEGVSRARITAFEHSKGELITFIDSDDYVSPEYIEKLASPFVLDDIDMVSCDYYIVENDIVKEYPPKMKGCISNMPDFIANHYFYDKICNGYGIPQFLCTKMARRRYVGAALNRGIGLWFGEDQMCLFHMLCHISKTILIPDRLYYYVRHSEAATSKYDYSRWESIIMMLEGIKEMDINHVASEGLRIRTWLHIKNMFKKIEHDGINLKTFVEHLSKARNTPYMRDFFRPLYIRMGYKENVKYWLLKLRLYRILYYCIQTR